MDMGKCFFSHEFFRGITTGGAEIKWNSSLDITVKGQALNNIKISLGPLEY
jgi:hypothetical protein